MHNQNQLSISLWIASSRLSNLRAIKIWQFNASLHKTLLSQMYCQKCYVCHIHDGFHAVALLQKRHLKYWMRCMKRGSEARTQRMCHWYSTLFVRQQILHIKWLCKVEINTSRKIVYVNAVCKLRLLCLKRDSFSSRKFLTPLL